MPFGKVPVLEVDGKKIDQSEAMWSCRQERLGISGNRLDRRHHTRFTCQ